MAKEQLRLILSANLRKYRNRREWSQMQLAEKANISMNFLSEIERGLKWPYPETLQKLADSLEIEVFELFKQQDRVEPDITKYMERFAKDMSIAIEESVKQTICNVQNQYRT